MNNDTSPLADVLKSFCLERIKATEDLAVAENKILGDLFLELSKAMGKALEAFDDAIYAEQRGMWCILDKRCRTILTEFGDVSFTRRIYADECKMRRTLLDEILSIRPRKRLSPGAFEALAYFGGEVSYRRAAKTVFRHCTTKVTPMTTLCVLREVGDLLEADAKKNSQSLFKDGLIPDAKRHTEELLIEADGIWVALQKENRSSVEIKALCAYQEKSKGHRINCMHHAQVAGPKQFFEEGVARIGSHFALDKIKRIYCGSDGGSWEKKLSEYLPVTEVTHKLDPWHVNRAIKTAVPDTCDQMPLFELLYSGDIDALVKVLELRYDSGYGDRKKIASLITYIKNNRALISANAPSLGTMESTNAHLYAARMKAFGGAWSIEGASDMARIRSYVFSDDTLPIPKREQSFTDKDINKRNKVWLHIQAKEGLSAQDVLECIGKGYEAPQGHLMPLSSDSPRLAMFNPLIRE